MQKWVYDDLRWWIDAIHQACCPASAGALISKGDRAPIDSGSFLSRLTICYEATLDALRHDGIDPELAQSLLFVAKSLKKWKFADNQLAMERKRSALLGFVERNRLAGSAGLVPWPYSGIMADILREWLPEPASTDVGSRDDYWGQTIDETTVLRGNQRLISEYTACTGKFGPGAVAEHWTHPRRFARLVEWCECSDHWPEAPLDHPDFESVRARLHAVPKDYSKDRLITVEPCYGSFVQQHVRQVAQLAIHHGPLRGTCMDLGFTDGQAIQRARALKASKTGKEATLDLKDASDNITWLQVQQVFPAWLVHLLGMARSTHYEWSDPLNPKVKFIDKMNIFAGMGNGTTFTVETLFFAAFVKAYARAWGLPQDVSVFGDDIICSSATASYLLQENFEFFRINKQKSFCGSDALREACGIFAYKGVDITVPKVDGYRDDKAGRDGVCDLHTRLVASRKPWARRLAYLIAAEGLLPNWEFVCEGFPSLDDELVERSPICYPTRWNQYYQCNELKLPVLRQVTNAYSTDDRTAGRFNHPPAVTWYLARLCGMIGGGDVKVTSPRSALHGQCTVRIPVKDHFRETEQWVLALTRRTCPPTTTTHPIEQIAVTGNL